MCECSALQPSFSLVALREKKPCLCVSVFNFCAAGALKTPYLF